MVKIIITFYRKSHVLDTWNTHNYGYKGSATISYMRQALTCFSCNGDFSIQNQSNLNKIVNPRCVPHIASLDNRRNIHLLLFVHKQTQKDHLIKKCRIRTRLQQAPVFKTYTPNNEKAKQNVLYRGAISIPWNALPACDRNKAFTDF